MFAGACLLPTRVLAYIQIGTFIVIVISVSWFFSTFFLLSVLSVVGSGPTIDCQDKKDCLKKVCLVCQVSIENSYFISSLCDSIQLTFIS